MNSNILEFFIKMRDLTAPQIAKTIENVRKIERTAEIANRTVQGISDRMHTLNSTDPSAGPVRGIQKITAEAKKLNTELEKTAGDGSNTSRRRSFLGMVGRSLAPYIATAAIGGFALSSFNAAAQFGAQQKTFEVLTGSRNRGEDIANQLFQLKQQTVLGPSVYKAAQTLMGFGISDKEVMKDLKMLGDVAMGDADRFQSLALVFSQTRQAGRLMGQDMLQYINAGFNPLGTMVDKWKEMGFRQQYTGMQLREMMQRGLITSQMVTKAFELATSEGGKFNHMLDKIAETPFGKMQMLKGKWAAFKIELGNLLSPIATKVIDFGSKILGWLSPKPDQVSRLNDQILTIRTLYSQLTSTNVAHERQIELLNQLEQINPKLTEGIKNQSIAYDKLKENVDKVTDALRDQIKLEVIKDKVTPTIVDYKSSLKNREGLIFDTMKTVEKYFPEIAESNQYSDETKIALAYKAARNRENLWYKKFYKENPGNMGVRSPYFDLIMSLEGNYGKIQNLTNKISKQEPEAAKAQKQIDDAQKIVDQFIPKPTNNGTSKGIGAMAGEDDLGGGISKGITGGGPRVININGVKFMEKMADHVTISNNGDIENVEQIFEEMFLRILNSGASVQ